MLLVVVLAVVLLSPSLDACSCATSYLHKNYCESQYLIRGRVLSVTHPSPEDINADMYYTVRIIRAYKYTSYFEGKSTVDIWTPGNDGLCKAPLVVGKKYYLGGKVNKGEDKLKIMLCDLWEKINELNNCQKNLISQGSFDCACTNTSCYQDC